MPRFPPAAALGTVGGGGKPQGEIVVRTRNMVQGYLGNAAATKRGRARQKNWGVVGEGGGACAPMKREVGWDLTRKVLSFVTKITVD